MPNYTTGEAARALDVSVRTVQYYDQKNLVSPSFLTEGGRRMYSDDDVRRLKAVCYLRQIGLPIASIQKLISDPNPESVIGLLIEQQKKELADEIEQRRTQLSHLEILEREIRSSVSFSLNSINDIASRMDNRRKLHRLYLKILILALVLEAFEWIFALIGFFRGVWLPMILYLPVLGVGVALISYFYIRNVDYICPECHEIFTPGVKEMIFARHTLRTRKLTCPRCGHKGFCIEVYKKKDAEDK